METAYNRWVGVGWQNIWIYLLYSMYYQLNMWIVWLARLYKLSIWYTLCTGNFLAASSYSIHTDLWKPFSFHICCITVCVLDIFITWCQIIGIHITVLKIRTIIHAQNLKNWIGLVYNIVILPSKQYSMWIGMSFHTYHPFSSGTCST